MPERGGPVVVDTTPIVALSLVERLDLLRDLYDEVLIPEAVRSEILAGGPGRAGTRELEEAPWIRPVALVDSARATFLSDLDRGEAEVIALAVEHEARLVVLDERLGRRHAARLGLPLTGTVGVLLRAKGAGLVPAVAPLFRRLQSAGFEFGSRLVAKALKLADEGVNPRDP